MSFAKSEKYIKSLSARQREVRQRILEISFKYSFCHLGSCLSAVDLIDGVYKFKRADETFVLSNGHAGVALYVILEKNGLIKDPKVFDKLYVHPDRNTELGISVSTGSLGQGLPIALGMAVASKNKNVFCMISDGECMEGSIWESLRIAVDLKVDNLKIILNANGWGAYGSISLPRLLKSLKATGCLLVEIDGHTPIQILRALMKNTVDRPLIIFGRTTVDQLPFLVAQEAHYHVMNEKEYLKALDLLLWS